MTLPGDSEDAAARPVGDMTTGVYRVPTETETEASRDESLGSEGLTAGSALLVVKRGPAAGSRYLLEEATVTAGRHPDSDIFLDDITVSRRHAEFYREGNAWHVRDLGSLNGTYLNRDPVDTASLASGDEVQIGKYRLVFLTGGTG